MLYSLTFGQLSSLPASSIQVHISPSEEISTRFSQYNDHSILVHYGMELLLQLGDREWGLLLATLSGLPN
jgi:hypothetical protein